MARNRIIGFRVPDSLADQIEAQAEGRGLTPSAFLRDLAERATAIDERDEDLAARLAAREPGAREELLGLNPVSLVHRATLGDDVATGLILALAADPAGDHPSLIRALVAALDLYRNAAPSISDMEALADLYGRKAARAVAEAA